MNSSCFHNRTKCIFVINSVSLLESFHYQPCFVPVNASIAFSLDFIDPLAIDNICSCLRWNQVPGFILQECIKFIVHGLLPTLITQCFAIMMRFTDGLKEAIPNRTICINLWFADTMLKPSPMLNRR
jgi:hypothetical protein